MKKSLFILLALAFCLSACTPAASPAQEPEAAAVAEETTETAHWEHWLLTSWLWCWL